MTAGIQTDTDFAFAGLDTPEVAAQEVAHVATAQPASPLGALAALAGTWKGTGFNSIWRPHHPASQDRFLELNETKETLVITPINEASTGAGLHIEPGIWATVPHTTDAGSLGSVVCGTVATYHRPQ